MTVNPLDRGLDDLTLVRIERISACREAIFEPLSQEAAVHGGIRQRKRVETTWFAQPDIGDCGAAGACEDFPAVLVVEVEDPRVELLCLREQEVQEG